MKKLELAESYEIKEEISELFRKNPLARFIHRLHAINFVAEGHDCYEAARVFGHSPRTIHNWVKTVNENGIYALQDDPRPGRPSRLTSEIRMILKRDLAESPLGMGYDSSTWDGKLLSRHLRKRYNIKLKIRRCQMLINELSPSKFSIK